MVKDASNMSYDELVSWAEEEAEMQTTKKKVVTPKKKIEHVVDDVDIPLMNLVESPKLKRKLLVRNSPSPIAKRKLMGKVTSPTSYVVNKGRSVLNEGNIVNKIVEKGKITMVKEVNTVKKALDKGKCKMVEEERHVHRNVRRNNGIVIEDNVNPTVESDTDSVSDPAKGISYSLYSGSDSESEYLSDKSVDYLSEGEEELIELRKRKTEAKNAPKVSKQQTQAANKGISSGVRQRKQYFVGDNETVIKHEGFMDDLLRKLSQDNGNGMTDQFHIVETKVEKYPIHDVDTHWRMRKPKQLKGCLTYYALANGYSLWFYRSSKTKLIAKCGLRPEKIKDPKLGKQSKFKRYPSEANRSKCRWRCYGKMMTSENSVQALNERETTIEDHYGYIRSYAKAILESNPGSTVKAVVNVKNKDKWNWFLDLLGDDLERHTGQGLIKAVKEVMPYVEHRQCARHIYEGFKKQYSGFGMLYQLVEICLKLGMRQKHLVLIKSVKTVLADYDNFQFDVGGSSQFDVGGEEQVTQFDMGGGGSSDVRGTKKNVVGGFAQFDVRRGRRVKTTVKRGGAGYRRSQNHQVLEQEPQATEQEPQAAKQEPHRSRPKGILNFIRPRPKSERILKKQLAKKVHGIGSTSSNALNLE
uniref:Pentatricopeptide repeat-containing protein n=1 Tax=Tanacetum cinerariifolium TaxID=118510 RepID=A0A6L2MWF3_TANCI|nr:pentatricopeptide repeat-containing protein [Tanacetum cinerariifolium]